MSTENPPSEEVKSLSLTPQNESSSSNPSVPAKHLSVEEKFRIVRSVGEECIQKEGLLNLLTNKPQPICYDGFEPSGRMHIAQADICQLVMDQRKVNVLAREYCDDIKRKNKPIIFSHHMLPGLLQGQEKMSKSDSSSAIFMEDEEAEVNWKIKKAYCPPNIVDGNPYLEYMKYIVFPWFNQFKVERKVENGGEKIFTTYEELIADYEKGELHPADLKPALSIALNKTLQPVRDHFKSDAKAKDLLKRVKAFKVTR